MNDNNFTNLFNIQSIKEIKFVILLQLQSFYQRLYLLVEYDPRRCNNKCKR